MDVVREANREHDVSVNADTMTPGWRGEPLSMTYAIDVLHPRAATPVRTTWVLDAACNEVLA